MRSLIRFLFKREVWVAYGEHPYEVEVWLRDPDDPGCEAVRKVKVYG